MGYKRDTSERGAIGISLRLCENGRHIAHSVRALLVSAPVPEREREREIANATWQSGSVLVSSGVRAIRALSFMHALNGGTPQSGRRRQARVEPHKQRGRGGTLAGGGGLGLAASRPPGQLIGSGTLAGPSCPPASCPWAHGTSPATCGRWTVEGDWASGPGWRMASLCRIQPR
jgi:hypothetical protein